jgi:subfamily B ATP-binding cassette protein MsbA
MPGHQAHSREVYGRLLRHVRPYRAIFALGIVGMLVLGATEAGIPALLKPLLDGTFVDKDPLYLTWAPLGIIVLFFVRGVAGIGSNLAFTAISTRLVFDLRQRMFDRLLTLPTRFYDHQATGNLISKLIYDVTQVTQAGTEVLTVLVKDTITVVALLGYVFWLDWQLSLFTFLLGPAVAAVAILVGRRLRGISRQLQNDFGDMTHVLEESTRGHKVVKIYGGQDYEQGRFEQVAKRLRQRQFKYKVASSVSVPTVELLGAVIMAAVIYIGTDRATADQLSVGGFVAFFTALGLLFSPIKRLTKINDPLQRGLAAAESVFALVDEAPEVDSGSHSVERCAGRLHFEQVQVRYPGTERAALGPLDLVIEPRTTTALVGASGSGKTTLANLVPRIYDPSAGRVLLDDVDLRDWRLAGLRHQISYVSQDVVLFNDTVANNIAYGSPATTDAIHAAADAAGALAFIEAMPQGFDTLIGENGVRLSGGQRQRLAIARALLADAPLLILDEATSALDTRTEQDIQRALKTLREGRTTLVIAHRLSTVEDADRIIVFDHGRIVEDGSHQSLLAKDGAYARLYASQSLTAPS